MLPVPPWHCCPVFFLWFFFDIPSSSAKAVSMNPPLFTMMSTFSLEPNCTEQSGQRPVPLYPLQEAPFLRRIWSSSSSSFFSSFFPRLSLIQCSVVVWIWKGWRKCVLSASCVCTSAFRGGSSLGSTIQFLCGFHTSGMIKQKARHTHTAQLEPLLMKVTSHSRYTEVGRGRGVRV